MIAKPDLTTRLKQIKLIVSDVDGVLTDGRIFLDAAGKEIKVFHVRDAFRIEIWRQAGGQILWFTGRQATGVITRAQELGADLLFKFELKGDLLNYIKKTYHLDPEQVLYVGDDWNDLYYLQQVGCSAAPANAAAENLQVADIVTQAKGGDGVLAELIEQILRSQNRWDEFVHPYYKRFVL